MRITQSIDLKKKDGFLFINAILLMGFFTFLFLGTEYLYVTVISHMVSDNSAVLAQNYALGVSAIGFLLYFLLGYFDRKRARAKDVLFILIGLIALFCIALISMEMAYAIVFTAGLVLFLLLGLLGSAAFSVSMKLLVMDRYLARAVGISYAVGIMLQFINNNLIRSELAKAIFLAVFLVLLVCLMIKNDGICADRNREKTNDLENIENSAGKNVRLGIVVGISLILLVALMTCVFSTLDNAVTLVHSSGVMDIGQWPRILLALSGISAGFVFDVKDRKYMGFVMYCVMLLSTICIAVLKFSGPFLLGLVIFYLSAGFFAVFFTSGFLELSRHMKIPELWVCMGRAVNNIVAAVIANPVLILLSFDNNLAFIVLVLVLFVAVSVAVALYMVQRKRFMEPVDTVTEPVADEKDRLLELTEEFSFTDREKEVFQYLINTEDNIQTIADNMYVSRRTLERYISSIYAKTGVKSRVGLINLYNR